MSWRYACPKCKASLNPKDLIMLVGSPSGSEKRMLVGFHPQPGNYEVQLPPGTKVEQGVRWDFCCPVCHEDLVADDDKLCAITLDEEGSERQVLFSRVAGEQATFIVTDRTIERQYGEAAKQHTDHLVALKYVLFR